MTPMEAAGTASAPDSTLEISKRIFLVGMRFLTDTFIKKVFPKQESDEMFIFLSATVPETLLFIGEALLQRQMKPATKPIPATTLNPAEKEMELSNMFTLHPTPFDDVKKGEGEGIDIDETPPIKESEDQNFSLNEVINKILRLIHDHLYIFNK